MSLPSQISQKYLARFTNLISEGESIQQAVITIPGKYYEDVFRKTHQHAPSHRIDRERLTKWKTNSVSLLDQVIPSTSVHRRIIAAVQEITALHELVWGISSLRGLADDLENGFLSDISTQIESALASNYMEQAEGLLKEGQSGKYDHVPAAVLAGAVLEKSLRSLCDKQVPPVPTLNSKGEQKTLNPLIDDLKKSGLFNESKAKQLRAWAAIRNHAAHGEFDQFNRTDVEQLLQGVNNFLAD